MMKNENREITMYLGLIFGKGVYVTSNLDALFRSLPDCT